MIRYSMEWDAFLDFKSNGDKQKLNFCVVMLSLSKHLGGPSHTLRYFDKLNTG
jgi:hypothetical protein